MNLSTSIQKTLKDFKDEKSTYDKLIYYFNHNKASRLYGELCDENNWEYVIDHLTIRTYNVESCAKQYEALGWKYDTRIDYKDQGWWANIYRHEKYPPMFIDQNYDDAPENLTILKKWVDVFGDSEYHHIAVRLVEGIEIEDVISMLNKKGVEFPGSITGPKGSKLRQIFSKAEVKDGTPFSILELAQRGIDKTTGKVYEGLINEQADSLMKDSVL